MLQPIGDRVIVKVKKEEEETVGGIVLASNAKKKPTEGEVVAVGEGAYGHAAIVDGKYDGWDTQIIEEGGNLGVDDVHRSSLGSSLSDKLAKGRITYARPVK